LSKVSARIDAWRRQRTEIAQDLRAVIAEAQGMLKEMGQDLAASLSGLGDAVRRRTGGRPKGYRASAETRAKLKAAWARRKAAAGASEPAATTATESRRTRGRKRRTMSAEARARIAAGQKRRWAMRKKSQQS
jgi:hypothetical protein